MSQEFYKGNSVQWWHNKAKAYGNALLEIHDLIPWGQKDVVEKVKDVVLAYEDHKTRLKDASNTILEQEAEINRLRKTLEEKTK